MRSESENGAFIFDSRFLVNVGECGIIGLLAGCPRCTAEFTVNFTFNGAGLENIWFVDYATRDIKTFLASKWFRKHIICRI